MMDVFVLEVMVLVVLALVLMASLVVAWLLGAWVDILLFGTICCQFDTCIESMNN